MLRRLAIVVSCARVSRSLVVPTRSSLPSRPSPSKALPTPLEEGLSVLDGARLVDFARVGSTTVSPDGTLACFEVRQYDWHEKKFDAQLWIADLAAAAAMDEAEAAAHAHLTLLTAGAQHKFTSAANPQWSPCGRFVAFLSDRGGEATNGTAVWIAPAKGPGEARLLASFPLPVGDLEWHHATSTLVVSAAVYVDEEARAAGSGVSAMEATAARDKAMKDDKSGLDAVLFKRLPIRQWDSWLTSAMPHPFYVRVELDAASPSGYTVSDTPAVDIISSAPTAVPSGAFGGSEDWAISADGAVAVSARPPLAVDEAWTTNRHIYLQRALPTAATADAWPSDESGADGLAAVLGECLTASNPGYDTTPTFSPDGKRLAWLRMKGAAYEADAVSIMLHDLSSGETKPLLEAETHFDHSPGSLRWSNDGGRLLFVADVRSRATLCSVDVAVGAGPGGEGVTFLTNEGSHALHGECADGTLLLSSQSFTAPTELHVLSADGSTSRQLTFFNRERLSKTAIGRVGEFTCTGPSGDQIQSWLLRPAGFSEADEASPTKKYPLAVIYHGGPQGSTGDDWHYRWNLQSYASAGFAVLGVNFRGSTGFGHKFCRAISASGADGVGWNVGGEDTLASVAALLETHGDWIDKERVVGLGASYGGFTSNWLNGNAPRGLFKALVCHCGTFDLRSSYYSTEELFFMEHEFGGPPFEDAAKQPSSPYVRCTPSAKVSEWETPTLVIHGAKDFRLVESEGIATFTALQRRGVPSEMLYLPGENHHCLNPQNSVVWHEAVMRWITSWTE